MPSTATSSPPTCSSRPGRRSARRRSSPSAAGRSRATRSRATCASSTSGRCRVRRSKSSSCARRSRRSSVKPFRVDITQAELDELRARLHNTRWAEDFGNADWVYGVERGWLQELVAYWADEFDWRAQEAAINRHPQFIAEIDGVPIHFLHIAGDGPPLVLTHGWPWTFWDYAQVIEELRGDFELIVPSLPRFGFSMPLVPPGVDPGRIAQLEVKL